MEKLTVGSLFSGIGGLEYGLELTDGFEVKWQVEIDDYATKVLAKHWPDVTRFRDIRDCGSHNLAPVDCIVGGFPCQPHSLAGKRQASGDERDLWGEFYRVICETQPRWVVAENVPGLLSSEDGRFFGRVLRDLAEAGYDAEWHCLRASTFGAPHQRERVFIVAYHDSIRCNNGCNHWQRGHLHHDEQWHAETPYENREGREPEPGQVGTDMADATGTGLPLRRQAGRATCETQAGAGMESEPERCGELEYTDCSGREECHLAAVASESRFACGATLESLENTVDARCTDARYLSDGQIPEWQEPRWHESTDRIGRSGTFPADGAISQSLMGGDTDGLSRRMDGYHRWPARPGEQQHAWEPPRTIAGRQPDRNKRLKALGNSVVPQVAEYVGRCILARMESSEVA